MPRRPSVSASLSTSGSGCRPPYFPNEPDKSRSKSKKTAPGMCSAPAGGSPSSVSAKRQSATITWGSFRRSANHATSTRGVTDEPMRPSFLLYERCVLWAPHFMGAALHAALAALKSGLPFFQKRVHAFSAVFRGEQNRLAQLLHRQPAGQIHIAAPLNHPLCHGHRQRSFS